MNNRSGYGITVGRRTHFLLFVLCFICLFVFAFGACAETNDSSFSGNPGTEESAVTEEPDSEPGDTAEEPEPGDNAEEPDSEQEPDSESGVTEEPEEPSSGVKNENLNNAGGFESHV